MSAENDFIRFLNGDRSMLKCTVCGVQAGHCDCWTPCPCGWVYLKGKKCRNPSHARATGEQP